MRSLSHSAAKAVMRQDMGSAHNKTAVAVSRCNKAAEKHDRPSFFARIDGFCRRHHLNDEFIDQLRQLGRTAADAVMNKKRWKAPCENTVQDAINEARGDNEFIPKYDHPPFKNTIYTEIHSPSGNFMYKTPRTYRRNHHNNKTENAVFKMCWRDTQSQRTMQGCCICLTPAP